MAAGLALALLLATGGEETPAPPPAPPSAPAQPAPPKPTAIEEQIAELQAQNQIDEDRAAPGAVNGEPKFAEAAPAQNTPPAQKQPVESPAPAAAAPSKSALPPPAPEPVKPAEPVKLAAPAVAPPPAPEPSKSVETAKPAAPPAPAAKKEKGPFSVRMSDDLEGGKAFELRDRLAAAGYQSWMTSIKARRELIRVEIGAFNSIKDAAPMSARLAQLGHATSATRLPNGQVTLVAGSFHSADNAQKLVSELSALGYSVTAPRRAAEQPMYVVKVGRYPTRDAAARAETELRDKGYTTLGIVR